MNIVITGSASGIGYGLASSFLSLGCSVAITSRSQENIDKAVKLLGGKYGLDHIFSYRCDVRDYNQVQGLWEAVKAHFGRIDIWINNAGIAHPETAIWDYSSDQIKEVIDTNLIGAMNGSVIALKGMMEQGFGSIYNMEGLGSGGPIIKGMALYGITKSALAYLTKSMVKETKGTSIIVGAIRPGMVATKLITEQYQGRQKEWERSKRIFNILSDNVETVTPWIAKKILVNRKNGNNIVWLTRGKLLKRFLLSSFYKRNIYD
jgi:NAD(P)-dependent dehydrogenase (short-subunit alcohol dehydrogenase family)